MRIRFKLWVTDESGKVIIGKGGHQLLRKIEEKGSRAEAARELDLSYKFAWEYVRKVNERVGGLEPRKGGKGHGGLSWTRGSSSSSKFTRGPRRRFRRFWRSTRRSSTRLWAGVAPRPELAKVLRPPPF